MAGSANVSFGYLGAQGRNSPGVFQKAGAGQTFGTTEASSTQSTITAPTKTAAGSRETVVRVVLSEEGYIELAANPTAAVATSIRVVANQPEYFSCVPGDKIAIIDAA